MAASVVAPLTESELGDDLKFAELTADVLGSLRQVRKLQRDQARLNQFVSPTVQKVLTTADKSLHLVSPRDRGKDILTGCIIANNNVPPAGWNGVVDLGQK